MIITSKHPNMSTGAGTGEVFVVAQLTKQVQARSLQRGCWKTVCQRCDHMCVCVRV